MLASRLIDSESEDLMIFLHDGRKIGYAIYGNRSGFPVIYFHGFPGSRYEGKLLHEKLKNSPFKVYAIDRPGIGLSSPQKRRTLLSWAEDVLEFANLLKIKRFAILGISGGGPYALACTYQIPSNRLIATLVVSGLGPMESGIKQMMPLLRAGLCLAKLSRTIFKLAYRLVFYSQFRTMKKSVKTIDKMIRGMSTTDQELFKTPEYKESFILDNYAGYAQGPLGTAQDVEIYARDWGFKLEEIPEDKLVMLIHGEADDIVPIEMGKYVADHIPNCESFFYEDGTHFTTAERYLKHLFVRLLNLFETDEVP
ncbi:MAG: alpha/beta hydrolase [Candidatus Lokiarchaeota archaeon]|nr:alpha/beta hydrolase [Candidatus Lokiarchaeota archaeon]